MLVVALFTLPLSAQQVSMETARMRASAFLNKAAGSAAKKAPRKAPQLSLVSTSDELYIFNDDANDSHIIMSSDERMPEVLGYSYEGTIDPAAIPCNMQAWLDDCSAQVRWLREHPEAAAERRKSPQRADIAPMLTCKFDQGYPYNLKCPEVDGERCVTGCTATAMAQIMHYWQWPKKTTFTIPAYTTRTLGIEIPAIPPTTIDWDNIANYCTARSTAEQKDAVATLMVLCGTAVKMNYEPYGSGASSTPAAYDLLDYDITSMQRVSRSNYSDADWEEMLYNELQQQRPIDYGGSSDSGGGHAFVIDGYQYHDDAYWHVNWGWSGAYVAVGPYYEQQYYTLDNMSYNYRQHAVIGIQPVSNKRLYAVDETGGKTTLYYDTEASSKGDKARPYGNGISTDVTEVEFHPSFANYKPKRLSFSGCTNLKQIKGIEYLNTEEMTDMRMMFSYCGSLTSLDLSSFNTEKVTNMSGMFVDCSSLTSLDLSSFNTANVTDMSAMFARCTSLTSLNVSKFNTAKVTNMSGMFNSCESLTSIDLSNFNTEKVTNMSGMFSWCNSLTSLDLNSFNTANVTDMSQMFSWCISLTSLDLSSFNTEKVTDMSWMFNSCESLTSLDLSSFNTEKVTNMSGMFYDCESLTSLDLNSFNTANVTDMSNMFARCTSLTSIDLSSFNTEKVTNMTWMFYNDPSLTTITVSNLWDVSNVTNGDAMFAYCWNLKGGAGTVYDSNNTGLSYAHVDGGPSNPGYLTYKTPTAIKNIDAETNATAKWYTLDGKRLYGKPVTKGVYIVEMSNGKIKKVMVK